MCVMNMICVQEVTYVWGCKMDLNKSTTTRKRVTQRRRLSQIICCQNVDKVVLKHFPAQKSQLVWERFEFGASVTPTKL